tara:strand:+ start:19697 stop:20275 length:579 start_codon:yes stop_codon:yes gene_type:complete
MQDDVRKEFSRVYQALRCKASCGSPGAAGLPLNAIQFNYQGSLQGSADLTWDDVTHTLTIGNTNPGAIINVTDYQVQLGDINHVNNGNVFTLDDTTGVSFIAVSNRFGIDNQNNQGGLFRVDMANSLTYLGDFSNFYAVSGTYISVEVLTGLVKITTVPTYASDAAAITGGLTSGHLYKKTTAGVTNLCIVP